jgi:hypothetical protein
MSRKWTGAFLSLLALVSLALVWWLVIASAPAALAGDAVQSGPTPDGLPGESREGGLGSPDISFIESPSPTCSRPVKGTNACYIRWVSLAVSTSPAEYIISMTVSIDGRLRAYYNGFFQNSMSVPYLMAPSGFRVDCGLPGSGGNPALGQDYTYVIRARDTLGLNATNTGTVYCPSDLVSIDRLTLEGASKGYVQKGYLFDAAILPDTATLPVTYTWWATDLITQTQVGGLNSSLSLTWNSPGLKTVTIQAKNQSNTMSTSTTIDIRLYQVFLPLIQRRN